MNLYVHFPFCRRKCTYCALHSRAGSSAEARAAYVSRLAGEAGALGQTFKTVYFGGGSPALCDLRPLFRALEPKMTGETEFTVELHPLDATREKLAELKAGGVNRISMGVQSLDDAVLAHMGRGYTFLEAERAFRLARDCFDNAGIDIIEGYPRIEGGDAPRSGTALSPRWERLGEWGLRHCSVYSLILEEKSILARQLARGRTPRLAVPGDDAVLDGIKAVSRRLAEMGLKRYEISNYAMPGYECRHNMAVWRGEDYIGLGEGAHGRIGLTRTYNTPAGTGAETERLSPEEDEKERLVFRLRTVEGIDATGRPEWGRTLDKFAAEGLVEKSGRVYRLTERGTEVCDSILAELV